MIKFREPLFNINAICKHIECKKEKRILSTVSNCQHVWNGSKTFCLNCEATCIRDSAGQIIIYDAGVL